MTAQVVRNATGTVTAPVLVGIDGTSASWDAVSWAEEELASRAADGPRRLVMCRSYPPGTVGAHVPNPPDMAWLNLADPGFARKIREVRQRLLLDDVAINVQVVGLADQLIGLATPASTIVLAAPSRHTHAALRVAAHAAGVVVAVRPTTPPSEVTGGPFAGHVVVGVDSDPSAQAAIEFAFDYASRHKKPVAAVHAHALDPGGAWMDGDSSQIHLTPYAFDLDLLYAAISDAQNTWPDVHVRRFVLREDADEALVRASAGAVLLVVGDRRRGPVARRVLGSVSRHVVGHAHCTVAVTHGTGWAS